MEIDNSYKEALHFAKNHYENFPVVSLLIPRNLQKHIAIIYWFARTADDIADEGSYSPEERLEQLNKFREQFSSALKGKYESGFFQALSGTIKGKKLSVDCFYGLLSAFEQDITRTAYSTFNEVLDYCSRSANPVGRLILELFGIREEKAFRLSDKICTALQLTNFYQDIEIDYSKGRVYFPEEEMERFAVERKSFELKENSLNFKEMLKFSIKRTEQMFSEGEALIGLLKGRLRYEIMWTVSGGRSILNKIKKNDYEIFHKRPELTKLDFLKLFIKSLFK